MAETPFWNERRLFQLWIRNTHTLNDLKKKIKNTMRISVKNWFSWSMLKTNQNFMQRPYCRELLIVSFLFFKKPIEITRGTNCEIRRCKTKPTTSTLMGTWEGKLFYFLHIEKCLFVSWYFLLIHNSEPNEKRQYIFIPVPLSVFKFRTVARRGPREVGWVELQLEIFG